MSQRPFRRYENALDPKRVRTDGTATLPEGDGLSQKGGGTAYERYKASLHAIFEGRAPLPTHLQKLTPKAMPEEDVQTSTLSTAESAPLAPATEERKSHKLQAPQKENSLHFIENVKQATTPVEVTNAINKLLLAGHLLPNDEEFLSKALGHQNEEVVLKALQQLKEMLAQKPVKSPRLLKTRLDNVSMWATSSEIRTLCADVKEAIG